MLSIMLSTAHKLLQVRTCKSKSPHIITGGTCSSPVFTKCQGEVAELHLLLLPVATPEMIMRAGRWWWLSLSLSRDYIDENSVIDRLKCGISLQVMKEPATIVPCGHTFDNKCLEQHRASPQLNRTNCPKCRGAIERTLLLPDMKQLVRETVKTRCIATGCRSTPVEELQAYQVSE